MYSQDTYDHVHGIVCGAFELDQSAFGPDTDIMATADQMADPERVEWVVEAIDDEFELAWPLISDNRGRSRHAQLMLPESLTVAELCEVVEAGAWPSSWTRPGKFVSPWLWRRRN